MVVLLLLHLGMRVGLALDITTTDGHSYWDCTISQVEPDALRITHRDGAARIPYERLPSAVQKQYFDPAKVAAYREQAAEARRVAELAAATKAEEERRQRAIAVAEAEEQREQAEEARQREAADQKAATQQAEKQRVDAVHTKVTVAGTSLVIAAILGIFLYFLPSIIGRHKTNAFAIFVLNFFLGWTFLGWVVALVWACTEDSAMDRLARERMNMPPSPPPRPFQRLDGQDGLEGQGGPQLGDRPRYLE
ncbi:MAG: superinfection immunity protein [Chthoniobacter sp.]|uniref:superinfection immunity protein n=1 Tax=Chthoniobacter sp. TaxID=2510640 RepID=UPI0032A49955